MGKIHLLWLRGGATLTLSERETYTNDDLLDLILDPDRENRSRISPWAAKSGAKTGQPSNRVFEIEIFGQIRVYTGSRPLRVNYPSRSFGGEEKARY